jgi:hypothetical protein
MARSQNQPHSSVLVCHGVVTVSPLNFGLQFILNLDAIFMRQKNTCLHILCMNIWTHLPLHCNFCNCSISHSLDQIWDIVKSDFVCSIFNPCIWWLGNVHQTGKLLKGTVWKRCNGPKKITWEAVKSHFLFNSVVGPVPLHFLNRKFSIIHLSTRNQHKCTCNLQCSR